MSKDKLNIYSNLLTWLNGRCKDIKIIHKNKTIKIWDSKMGVNIEDSILNFCKENRIDIKSEIGVD